MENQKSEDEENERVINRTLNECIEIENPNIGVINKGFQKSMFFSVKTWLFNAKDIVKFNFFSLNTSLNFSNQELVHLFSHEFDIQKENNLQTLKNKIAKLLYYSYRKNFNPIINYKNKAMYTSDCGWGCMIRSSQMIFARAIYKILRFEQKDVNNAINSTLSFFYEMPYTEENVPECFSEYVKTMVAKKKKNDTNNISIKSIYPPFSINPICGIGEIYDKAAGEWFSDVNMPKIYNILNENMGVIPKLKIITFQSLISLKRIINSCFTKVEKNEVNEENIVNFMDEKYKFNKYGLLFVSVRIGINNIVPEYHQSIKTLFTCKQCIGFIGGKDYSASYFIGYSGNNIFYLDPHYSQETIHNINNKKEIEKTYLTKKVYQLKFDRLQTAFTVGFLFRNVKEFKELQTWIEQYCKNPNPCIQFEYGDSSEDLGKAIEKYANINMDKDDF